MATPTEIADELNVMWADMVKSGAFDQHASTIQHLTEMTLKLAREVQRLEAEARGKDAAMRMLVDSVLLAGRPRDDWDTRGEAGVGHNVGTPVTKAGKPKP